MQPPIDIPRRHQSFDSSSNLLGSLTDSQFLVGSPDVLNSDQDLYVPNSQSWKRTVNASPSTSRVPPGRPGRHPEHQWSLFGQLMENEGFLSPNTLTRRGPQHSTEDIRQDAASSVSALSPRVYSQHVQDNLAGSPYFVPTIPNKYDTDETDDSSSISSIQQSSVLSSEVKKSSYWHFSLSSVTRNVLKCAIAYFIASLFTFMPFLSQLISDIDYSAASSSGHMVATIAVYFNPAKTVGAMIEADLFCLLGIIYATFVCLVSMSMFWWFEVKPGWEWAADIIALSWIGLSIGAMAWMKVWMENPSFNTACSMTSIIIFVVVIKEGGLTTLLHVSGIILCGSVISNLVCFSLWPQTAISNLKLNMTKTLDSFSTLLPMLTKIFLLENDQDSRLADLDEIQQAVENHQNSFTGLQKSLREAKSEWMLTWTPWAEPEEVGSASGYSRSSGRDSYEDAVGCLNRLAQHLNGLRSGTPIQREITKAGIQQRSVEQSDKGKHRESDDGAAVLSAAAVLFGDLVDELGPPMNALSTTCTSTLNRLRNVCEESQLTKRQRSGLIQPHEFSDLIDGIEAALKRFESTSNHAVLRLYRRSDANGNINASFSSFQTPMNNDWRNIAEGDNENIFLVYFFIFTLQEFAKELILLVDSVERIYCYEQRMIRCRAWWLRFPTWVQKNIENFNSSRRIHSEGYRRHISIRKSLSYMMPAYRIAHPGFPKIRPHAPDTIQTPSWKELSIIGKVKQTLWSIGKRLKERDTKYAIKVGLATTILAFPAFLEATRPTFLAYWGDWALISFFVVISPTIGATNYLSLQRFLGTLFGAAVAVAFYTLSPEDAVILSIGGFLFSLPCFYYAVAKPQYLSASRFVLLTYNLTCLYCYNLRQRDVSAIDIGIQRSVAVVAGIVWAAFISRFWWPSEARRELSKSLSEFCLHIGWLYTRLVASNSFAPEYKGDDFDSGPSHRRHIRREGPVTKLNNSIPEFMAMELHLQIKLIELQALISQAQHEPRLKGPFPVGLYRKILISLQTILDKLHSMRCVTTREEWYTSVRQDFIVPVNKERREMVGNIMLFFSILAASFRLKAPLPPYLPPVEKSRLRLVAAIRKLDIVKNRDVKISRQLLFFAYALTMKGVTVELELLGRTLQDAFGVIGQTSQEFEMLFLPLDESHGMIDHVA